MPKFVFHDDNGRKIHAGGLLLYDKTGIWVIKEYYRNTHKLIDPGGKYVFQDCDIINTIWREFSEETYFIIDLSPTTLRRMISEKKAEMIYVCPDINNNPTYACLLVDISGLNIPPVEELSKKFNDFRNKALINNPLVPRNYYTSFELCYIPYDELHKEACQFHYRLKQISLNSFLRKYIQS
jgi:hypothetical protein